MALLHQILDNRLQTDADFYCKLVPNSVLKNLHPRFNIRPYQLEALGRFNYHYQQAKPKHLLYHMATGSGKTLIMAGLILQLYQEGYRNFLFFVNSTNIIDKTRDNFLNPQSSKYLFAPAIIINHQPVIVKEASNFEATNTNDITIVFTTIQGLHGSLQAPRENSITLEDFEDKRIVMLSDEAHHINADTKRASSLSKEEQDNIVSWEKTVNNILEANAENLLLEFTATADLSHTSIAKKYADKLIFNYALSQFRQDGFSKEVTVLQTDAQPFDMALQALIASKYRQLLFEQQRQNIKPVVLFKSKTIASSEAFYTSFCNSLKAIDASTLLQLQSRQQTGIVKEAFDFFASQNINLQDVAQMLQMDFSSDKLLVVNSKDDSELKQIAVNTLEDESNHYRAIFAVDKLNEGWDVLNLFDIVRLYESTNNTKQKTDKTTVSEAQLIGRGARYCPFALPQQPLHFVRQFDTDSSEPLRWCETLVYHCAYNPTYITELREALVNIGIVANERTDKPEKKQLKIPAKHNVKQPKDLLQLLHSSAIEVTLHKDLSKQEAAFSNEATTSIQSIVTSYYLKDLGDVVIQKAIQQLPQYQFQQLKQQLPFLSSISSFINNYLNDIAIKITYPKTKTASLSAEEKLAVCRAVLEQVGKIIYTT